MKNIIKLSIISEIESKNHAILKLQNGAVMKGNDLNGYDFECGNCEKILATGLFHQQIRNIVFVCEKCGNHSIIKFDWKVYILKYIREKIDYSALAVGFFLMLVISTINISNQTKLFLDIAIFIISLNYKYLIQVFQETK